MPISTRVSGVWKNITNINYRQAGSWKNITNAWVRVNGIWKNTFSSGSYDYEFTISSNTARYILRNALIAAGWNTTDAVVVNVTIPTGVTVYAEEIGHNSFTIQNFPTGSQFNITLNGTIVGKGGTGGSDFPRDGTFGGQALVMDAIGSNIFISGNGTIAGGGGGGGAAPGAGGGGGGGSTLSPAAGGGGDFPGEAGGNTGGSGGIHSNGTNIGGDGGNRGEAGEAGTGTNARAGGAAGNSIGVTIGTNYTITSSIILLGPILRV